MRTRAVCHQCADIEGIVSRSAGDGMPVPFPEEAFVLAPVDDDGVCATTCPRGHAVRTVLQHQPCELLFERGALAFHDGHLAGAMTSWGTALERGFELFVRVALRASAATLDIDAALAPLRRSSERQFGAFWVLAHAFGDGPRIDAKEHQQMATLRNGVVHDGHMPTEAEAWTYARWVFLALREIITAMHRSDVLCLALQEATSARLMRGHRGAGWASTEWTATIVRTMPGMTMAPTFDEGVADMSGVFVA